jgi:hypothetical protein
MIYALNPKNHTKYTNYVMQKKKKHRKKFRNQNLKLLNYKDLLTENKTLIKKIKSNKFCKKPKEKICFFTFV